MFLDLLELLQPPQYRLEQELTFVTLLPLVLQAHGMFLLKVVVIAVVTQILLFLPLRLSTVEERVTFQQLNGVILLAVRQQHNGFR
jgi:hypothetical protein